MRSITFLIPGLILALVLLGAIAASAEIKALVYEFEQSGNWNFTLLEEQVTKAGGEDIKYELTADAQEGLKLENTSKYDMVLFGTHGIGGWSTYHLEGVEEDLMSYVESGGFILIQTSDDTFFKGDMFPAELKMRESDDHEFEVTPEGEELGIFDKPNEVINVTEDDSYQEVEDPWVVLATSKNSGTPHTLLLSHGEGEYIVTSTRADGGEAQAVTNLPLVENVVNYFVKRVKEMLAVAPAGRLAASWGAIKQNTMFRWN
ncbi:hypothetical protein ACFL6S_18565 [Candidatus Poribacteria bacterium]